SWWARATPWPRGRSSRCWRDDGGRGGGADPQPGTADPIRARISTARGGDDMKFGIFYEHQLPRPWAEDSEYKLLQDSLTQIELADQLGYDYAWEVEHHFLEEYSHSSAPEVFLGAASQRTRNIRLGHGII